MQRKRDFVVFLEGDGNLKQLKEVFIGSLDIDCGDILFARYFKIV